MVINCSAVFFNRDHNISSTIKEAFTHVKICVHLSLILPMFITSHKDCIVEIAFNDLITRVHLVSVILNSLCVTSWFPFFFFFSINFI